MDFFEQLKTDDVPSYVDRLIDEYQPDGAEAEDYLPWEGANAAQPGRRGLGGRLGRLLRFGQRPVPVRRAQDGGVPLTKSFLSKYGGFGLQPLRFLWKLLSLTALPGFYAGAFYLFFRFFMGWGEYSSTAVLLCAFFFVLRDSVLSLGGRPSLLEVLRLFLHEAALVWLMWVFASMAYTVCVSGWGTPYFIGTFAGLLAAGVTYYFSVSPVGRKTGASKLLPYLMQVLGVVATTAVGLAGGYVLAPLLWPALLSEDNPVYGNYLVAMLVGFGAFWVGVHLFYIPAGRHETTSESARGWGVQMSGESE